MCATTSAALTSTLAGQHNTECMPASLTSLHLGQTRCNGPAPPSALQLQGGRCCCASLLICSLHSWHVSDHSRESLMMHAPWWCLKESHILLSALMHCCTHSTSFNPSSVQSYCRASMCTHSATTKEGKQLALAVAPRLGNSSTTAAELACPSWAWPLPK